MNIKIAFLGLGVMGYPMAGHLARAGNDVCAYNRTTEKAQKWFDEYKEEKITFQPHAIDAVKGAKIVFACLGDDPDVRDIALDVIPAMEKGSIFVDHTTASPQLARELSELAKSHDIGFVDAPVSGGEAGAVNGKLSIMCGASDEDFAAAQPIMACYALRSVHVGPCGHGQLCKAVNQICIAGVLQGLSEGVHFAQQAGIDIDKMLEAISGGAAQSWQMENRTRTMAKDEFEFGFAVDWMRKDLRIALSEARDNGARLPLTALVDQHYADVQSMGGGRWDTSSLLRRLTKKN